VRRAIFLSAVVIAVWAQMSAQETSVLVGGVRARYADSVSGTAALTAIQFSGTTRNTAVSISGSLSKFSGGEWVTQLSGFGAAVMPVGPGVSAGVTAGAGGNRIEGGTWNGQASGGLLAVFSRGGTLVTSSASLGTVRTIFDSTLHTTLLSLRLQQNLRSGVTVSGGLLTTLADTVRFTDVTAELTYTDQALRASVGAGFRGGGLEDDPWIHGNLELAPLERLRFELSLGRYPQNLVGFTDGMYLTIGTRVAITGSLRRPTTPIRPVELTTLDRDRVRLTIRYARDATSLEIAGEWNGWLPLPLERAGGDRWTAELMLEPGIFKYAIVIDGEEWTVPDGVTAEPDDFGGVVATLVVAVER